MILNMKCYMIKDLQLEMLNDQRSLGEMHELRQTGATPTRLKLHQSFSFKIIWNNSPSSFSFQIIWNNVITILLFPHSLNSSSDIIWHFRVLDKISVFDPLQSQISFEIFLDKQRKNAIDGKLQIARHKMQTVHQSVAKTCAVWKLSRIAAAASSSVHLSLCPPNIVQHSQNPSRLVVHYSEIREQPLITRYFT